MKTYFVFLSILLIFSECNSNSQTNMKQNEESKKFVIEKSEKDWQEQLNSDEYKVLRQCGTELPGTGKYDNFYKKGKYVCSACGQILFDSETKYSSGSGWPSFYDVISDSNVVLIEDNSLGMTRTEVKCSKCGGHLGHVFQDGPKPTGLRYCINSVSMKFIEADTTKSKNTVAPH
jgi:peptide-methionine (R)-S-oxide reductase